MKQIKFKSKVKRTLKKAIWLLSGGYKPKKFWDEWAPTFIKDPWQIKVHQQHKWLLKILKKSRPNNILEVGCGFGRNIKFLVDNGIAPDKITGTDISPNMIGLAKKYVNNKKVSLIATSIEDHKTSKKFDFLFTHGVLMHIPPANIKFALEKIIGLASSHLVFIEQNYKADNDYTFVHNYKSLLKERNLDIIEYQNNKKLGLDLIYAKVREK